MNTPDYGHLLLAPIFLYAAIRYTFAQRLFGHPPRWPYLSGGYFMSAFSRWLLFGVCTAMALWELLRGVLHLRPTLPVVVVSIIFLIALSAAYRRDRRRSQIQSNVA
jgi:hypothetical protein